MERRHDDSAQERDDLLNHRTDRDHHREPVRPTSARKLDPRGTLRTAVLGAVLASTGCTTVEQAPSTVPARETLFICYTQSTCAARSPATVSEAHEVCADTSTVDADQHRLPGSVAADEWAAVWRTTCEQREGIADLSSEDLCEDNLGAESWGCDVQCEPQFLDCDRSAS